MRSGVPMKVRRGWPAIGMQVAFELMGKCRQNALETAQIYGAAAYLKGVHIVRDFFLYQIAILGCVMMVVFGIILMEGSIVFFVPVQAVSRGILAFVIGAVDLLVAGLCLASFASSDRWLRQAAKYNTWVASTLSCGKDPAAARSL